MGRLNGRGKVLSSLQWRVWLCGKEWAGWEHQCTCQSSNSCWQQAEVGPGVVADWALCPYSAASYLPQRVIPKAPS